MDKEPALIVGAIAALLNVVAGFIHGITPEQVAALNAAIVAVAAVITRGKVTPA